jgi:DNA-directed RNA polymerase beta subunit/intein/homing endonuclease
MRNFGIDQQFEDIKKAATLAIGRVFPVVGRTRTLSLDGVTIEDTSSAHDYVDQAKTKNDEGTWGVNVYASVTLKDNATSTVLDRATKVRLFTLPKLTARMSYIVKGNEYQVHNQLRLKPGVYTLRRQNGQLKTQVNLAKGKNFDLTFAEESGIFYMTNIAGGTGKVPLYPVLTYLGVSPGLIARTWGTDIEAANRSNDPRAIAKAAAAFGVKPGSQLKDYLSQTKLGEETTELVLGKAFDKVDGPMLLAASKNLHDVHMGKKEPVDRDSLMFKDIHSVEDFIGERLEKNTRSLGYKIQRGLNNPKRTKISQILNPGSFSSTVESFFTQDDKSATPEQTNPLEMLTGAYATTIMGAGGIGSEHAITPEMRQIHPTHYGLLDPIHTPESKKIGANLHLPIGVRKDGKDLKMAVKDQDGKDHFLTARAAWDKKVALPGQKGDVIDAMHRGETIRVKRKDVDFFTPAPSALFSWSTNLIPFLASNQGNRAMMAAKQMEQAISLKHREAPLVQVGATPGASMEEVIGGSVAAMAPDSGTVKKVTPDFLVLATPSGDKQVNLYNNFTLNRKSFLNHEVKVKVGDKVAKGDLLADSNFSKNGTLALGTNMRVAYLPYKGLNFEDGVVITNSGADQLTSEHVHKEAIDRDVTIQLNLAKFRATYPSQLTPANAQLLDEDGVIKKGSKVTQGTILVAALKQRPPSQVIAVINKALSERPRDVSVYWHYEDTGYVMDVQKRKDKILVYVKTEERARIGDKIAGRNGNKGIITKIIPDSEAPKDKAGNPVHMLLNPHGVISRINIGQIYESAAGKAALKDGKPHVVDNFSGENYLDTTRQKLKKSGVLDKEELFDAATGKSLGKVHVGNPYILKLYKQGTHNYSVRQGGSGHPYDGNHQPLKAGGAEGAKALDVLTMNAMLAHGARHNLREMATYKSDQNEEFWRALKVGDPVPAPRQTFAYTKFLNYLKAAGVDVEKNGTELTLGPLTDKHVEKISVMAIKDPQFFRAKDFVPVKGGFFDHQKLGGFQGDKWSHLDLAHAVVNPVFEDAVKKITDLGSRYDKIMAGKLFLDPKTKTFNETGVGLTSGEAIESILKGVDVAGAITRLEEKAKTVRADKLDDINKKLKILKNLVRLNLRPEDAYIRRKLPVIPPQFRPLYPLPDGNVTTSDINVLYHNTGVVNYVAQLPGAKLLPETEKADIRKELYDHVSAVSGLTNLNVKGRTRDGFIAAIKGGADGGQPKEGYFISKLLSKKQDLVGRGTIIPEPDLGIDEMAMPEEMAWKLFEPFVIRELKGHGKSPLAATEEVKGRTKLARTALDRVMKDRHVLLNRAPSLHKFSIMAFKPKITTGRALKIPPLVIKGFNADFNGDSCDISTLCHTRLLTDDGQWVYLSLRAGELFPLLVGKSVEDMVADAGGYTAIYELSPGRLQTISMVNSTPIWADVRRLTVHTSHGPCYQLETHTGTRVVATEHHNFSYIDEKFNLQCVKTEVMPAGVLLPKARPRLGQDIQSVKIGEKSHVVDEDFAWLLGHYAGDGCSADNTVTICDTERALLDRSCRTIKAVFNSDTKRQSTAKHAGCIARIYNKTIAAWFADECGARCEDKRVPDCIVSSPDSVRLAYVQGLFQAEGSIGKDALGNWLARIEMKNRPFLEALRFIMASVGIGAYIRDSEHKGCRDFAIVRVVKDDMHRLALKEGRKSELLKTACEVKAGRRRKNLYDIVPFSAALFDEIAEIGKELRVPNKELRAKIAAWREAVPGRRVNLHDHFKKKTHFISRHIAKDILHTYGMLASGLFEKWAQLVLNEDLLWEEVTSITEVPRHEVMFDFTVPDGEIFCIQNGLLTHNTMTVHVPISNEANKEAEGMLPSRNLFQPGSGALMMAPAWEAQTGIFYLSQTPAGRAKLDAIVGEKYKVTAVLDKKGTAAMLNRMAKELPSGDFAKVLQALKSAGETHSYEKGFSLGLDDLHDFSKSRDLITTHVDKELAKAKTEADLTKINKDAVGLLDRMLATKLRGTGNSLFDMVEGGGRGEPTQLRQIMATPLFVSDARGKIVPRAIKKSYSEGLNIGDYWTSMYGARRGMMDRAIQTSEPGAFSKSISATTLDNVITAVDCGVKAGITLGISSPDAVGRYLAHDQDGVARNTPVDQQLVSALQKRGVSKIEVRSPLTCLQPRGTCAKCFGHDEHGGAPAIGDNIGAKASQTISEPLVQMIMRTFHTGGAAGTGTDVGGYARIGQLLKMPGDLPGAAPLTPVGGKVERIDKGIGGGHNVFVGSHKIYVPVGRKLTVKVGDEVTKGDVLSDGAVKPQDLVKLKGMRPAQEYLVDELHKTYKDQGIRIERKMFETVVRSLGNFTQVLNSPKDSPHLPGDVIGYTVANHYNANLGFTAKPEDAIGYELDADYEDLKKGHVVDARDAKVLKSHGHAEISVRREPLKHAPLMKGMGSVPLMRQNWMAALGFQNLSKAITEGAAQGWKTDLAGTHPIPAFAHGATFGQGKDGKY